jgi:phosphoribosylformylglycinamidine cyclo-ligase
MFRTFNMGVGMVVILPENELEPALECLQSAGVRVWRIGDVVPRSAATKPIVIV